MQTFNQKLEEERDAFNKRGTNKYGKTPMPEVVAYLREYKATGKYPYNADVEAFIKTREEVRDALEDHLGTEVYLAQKFLHDEDARVYSESMLAKGYIKAGDITTYRGPAELIAKKNMDLFTTNIGLVGKIITSGDDRPFFVPKGRRSRGYYLGTLESAFIKIIK